METCRPLHPDLEDDDEFPEPDDDDDENEDENEDDFEDVLAVVCVAFDSACKIF